MAYDARLAERVRRSLSRRKAVTEKKMFGGIAFLLRGKMCCGVLNDELVVRVGVARYRKALERPHVRPMDFTGRPLTGFVFVGRAGCQTDRALKKWLDGAIDFVSTLRR